MLLKRLTQWLKPTPNQCIFLIADREFVGAEFRSEAVLGWGLIPIIRIRANAWVEHRGRRQRVTTLFDTPHWRQLRLARKVYDSQWQVSDWRMAIF